MTSPQLFTGRDLLCLRGGRLVFQDLDFQLAAGGCLTLVGPNGSGKSTLLRLMAGLLKPLRGTIAWNGVALGQDPEAHRARLHYVGHLDAVKASFTCREMLAFWAGLRGGVGVDAALDAFAIDTIADVPGRFLSAGQRRRLSLARLVAAPAPLWLLDEPTVGLDRASVALLEEAIARHRAGGGRVVLSTHIDLATPGGELLDLATFAPVEDDQDGTEDAA
ncbi:heme ABC exporter ATP-binding protein CcmA [Nitrospirillum amazonense]|uniref:Heme exporter protein A n=1 Tax=Nitrospirillum amazonense TaxID=28077 RepID=A0A560JXM7_9PROT|nr:heme ABC exporter ATP-binding protein CcmA [Nitrospirillum amazonense]MDG3440176.1 heme ABC exporter ATP-binding protein CcmA [Nitrospirillum amazonense]TWB75489.1 heme exporter protein A [Nitrospirillum amazonense]